MGDRKIVPTKVEHPLVGSSIFTSDQYPRNIGKDKLIDAGEFLFMSTPRLQQQFIRLWQRCHGQDIATTLQQLSEVLSCSRRHVRSLLGAMQQQGWISWHPESGRGKRSQLKFHYTGLALQQQRAEELLEQDRIDQLVQLVGDKNVVRQMLLSQLGRSFRQGKHILRVLYLRQFH